MKFGGAWLSIGALEIPQTPEGRVQRFYILEISSRKFSGFLGISLPNLQLKTDLPLNDQADFPLNFFFA